jgi:hypothetical protein
MICLFRINLFSKQVIIHMLSSLTVICSFSCLYQVNHFISVMWHSYPYIQGRCNESICTSTRWSKCRIVKELAAIHMTIIHVPRWYCCSLEFNCLLHNWSRNYPSLVYDRLQVLIPVYYLCKYYFILGDVNISLVQYLTMISEIFVENKFYFYNILLCYREYSWKTHDVPLTIKPIGLNPLITTSDMHLFCLSLL